MSLRKPRQVATGKAAEEAVEWFVRIDAGPLGLDDEKAWLAWIAEPANAAAYAKVSAVWGAFPATPAPRPACAPMRAATTRPFARRPAQWTAGALAAVLVLALLGPSALLALQADVVTAAGEIKTVKLSDGSRVTLNTRSAIAFAITNGERRVRLLAGEAEFAVAPDSAHPFVVTAGGGATTALGTVFAVRETSNGVTVTSLVHRVAVETGDGRAVLVPGQQVHYGDALGPIGKAPIGADAWTRGHLVVENMTLAAVVAELNRYTHCRIVVLGAGDLRVNGVFPVTDTQASVAILKESLGLEVTWLTRYVVILRR